MISLAAFTLRVFLHTVIPDPTRREHAGVSKGGDEGGEAGDVLWGVFLVEDDGGEDAADAADLTGDGDEGGNEAAFGGTDDLVRAGKVG